jgi:XTP/dITP diphosphohydrolase
VITLVGLRPEPQVFEGVVRGQIAHTLRGTSGFGYDPIFIPDGHERTFAEMSLNEKNQLSHRAMAVSKVIDFFAHYQA